MDFSDRFSVSDLLVRIVHQLIWTTPPLAHRVAVVPLGHDQLIPEDLRQAMRSGNSSTARHLRFTPDFFVVDRQTPELVYLLDYKATQTPIYSTRRIAFIGREAKIPHLHWKEVGQMEAEAYDNYMALARSAVEVAVLNYCAYAEPPLLCDFVQGIRVLHRDEVTTESERGSRTPFVNFHLKSMRSLDDFLQAGHHTRPDQGSYQQALQQLAVQLPVRHHRQSPLWEAPDI